MVGIDTVVLTLPARSFIIMDRSRFTPNAATILNAGPNTMGKGRYISAVCNPSKRDNAAFGYLLYLTLYRALRSNGLTTELRIQFSAPKLLNGENFSEIEEWEFGEICHRILDALDYFKIKVYGGPSTIASAQVSAVHYSKNFVLTDYMTSRNAILELKKADVNAWRNVRNTKYDDDGFGYKTHSKYHELAFYDKIAEYNRGKRKQPLFDKDNQLSFDLFDEQKPKMPFEVLRMEVRLGKPQIIKTALRKAKVPADDLSFNAIYRKNYSKAVLAQHLVDLYSRYPKITEAITDDPLELLSDLFVQNPNRQMSTIMAAIGLHTLSKTAGMRSVKDIIGPKGSPALLRLAKRTNKELSYRAEKSEVFHYLEQELNRFEPVHLANFLE